MSTTRFKHIQRKTRAGQAVYMPYVLMGYPNFDASLITAKTLIDAGADGLELGLPFRDPVADGPVIQNAANIALDNGFKANDALKFITELRAYAPDIPFTLMSYYNIVLAKGVDSFIPALGHAGLDGLLIPDLPPEHAPEVFPITQNHNIDLVFIVAPTTNDARIEKIKDYAGGFIYVVTKMGTTGTQEGYDENLEQLFTRIKEAIDLPAIAGFGISTAEHAQNMVKIGANGVIVGSQIVKLCSPDSKGGLPCPTALSAHTKKIQAGLSA
jgi:tryptophan synthase alpha chain